MQFIYHGKTRGNRDTKGEISARDEIEARMFLREQQIRPTKLVEKGKLSLNMDLSDIFAGVPFLQGRVTTKDLVVFTRQFSVMIDSGIPQIMALEILARQTDNPAFKRVIEDIRSRVEQGQSLSAALERHTTIFSPLYKNLVAAGEAGGALDIILRRLAEYLEKSETLNRKIKGALFYPVTVMVIALGVVWVLLTYVVPRFAEILQQAGGEMPLPTQLLLHLSHVFVEQKLLILLSFVGIIAIARVVLSTPPLRKWLDGLFLSLPIFGILIRKTAVARFSRTLSTLLQSGVPILDSMEICARIAGNHVISQALLTAKTAISEGKPMAAPLERSGVFPPMVTQMVGVGEKTGALDQMLSKLADFYESEVDVSVTALTSLIEPLMILVLGVIGGGMIVSLYLPIFKLAGAVGGASGL